MTNLHVISNMNCGLEGTIQFTVAFVTHPHAARWLARQIGNTPEMQKGIKYIIRYT
jgi:hypothetical protein